MVAREADSGAPISLAGQAATEWCARDGDAISMVYVVHLGAEAVTIQYLVKPGDTEAAQVLRTLEWTEQ